MSTKRNTRPRAARRESAALPTAPDTKSEPADDRIDLREQIYNNGLTGQIERLATALDEIIRVRSLMVDVDPKYFAPRLYAGEDGTPADRLYTQTLRCWLDRHPVLKHAEVRHSGGGLHVLQHLEPHVELVTTGDRALWAAVAQALRASIPSDPRAPGLTAHTRPLGSINSRTGLAVRQLRAGQPVPPKAVLDFVADARRRPFAVLAGTLFGTSRIAPCPVCRAAGSSMGVLDWEGRCYGKCGKVRLERLFETFMVDPATDGRV